MNIIELQESSEEAANLLQSMANPKRLMLLCQLADGEKSVGALTKALSLTQSNVSQQLALLRKDGIVKARRTGQTINYSLSGKEARHIIKALHEIYCCGR